MMERRWDRDTNRARTAHVGTLGQLLERLMNDGSISDPDRVEALAKANDAMPECLEGVRLMLIELTGPDASTGLGLLVPSDLARFFIARHVMRFFSVVVEAREDHVFLAKNRFGGNGRVPSLEGEVLLSEEPRITARFRVPGKAKV